MAFALGSVLDRLSILVVVLTILATNQNLLLPLPCRLPLQEVAPERLSPGPSPLEGAYEPNTLLRQSRRLFEGAVNGSESVAFGPGGEMLLLDKYGYMKEAVRAPGGSFQLSGSGLFLGAGRPLGGHALPSGELVVCDSVKGLLSVNTSSREIAILSNAVSTSSPLAAGTPITYANDLDVAADGSIYFSDSSGISPQLNREGYYDTMRAFILTGAQGGATGRLLKYDPRTRQTHSLVEGIWYANGIALAKDESFVLVVETWSLRVLRHWLEGPKAGSTEIFVDRLPGYPDGISRAADGTFWVAIAAKTLPLVDLALPYRVARLALAWATELYRPRPKPHGMVVKVSEDGAPLWTLQDPGGKVVPMVTSVTEHEGKLYMGNLAHSFVAELDLSVVSTAGAASEEVSARDEE